ncbi:MAG: hypothetical protein ACE5DI_03680 [Candidatus Micrarchaeia archaeon]
MHANVLKKNAVVSMRKEALRLRKEYLEYAEDMELFSKPDFWKAVSNVEKGRTRKTSVKELRKELNL